MWAGDWVNVGWLSRGGFFPRFNQFCHRGYTTPRHNVIASVRTPFSRMLPRIIMVMCYFAKNSIAKTTLEAAANIAAMRPCFFKSEAKSS
jgi:hypothetical protein